MTLKMIFPIIFRYFWHNKSKGAYRVIYKINEGQHHFETVPFDSALHCSANASPLRAGTDTSVLRLGAALFRVLG